MIREINISDAEEIQKICKITLGYDVDISTVKNQINKLSCDNKHHIIAVYEDDNIQKAIGFVHAQVYESVYSDTGLNILGLAVDPKFQGNGVGKKLMYYIEKYALDNNMAFIRLNSANYRLEAHKFYENIGYTSDKLQKRFIKIF
ncbi:GNAT family N-acetyltransferase [Lachnoanaerobaculum sp. Marseille-Q4761]|uniref:GNAT family N-acetyltransferase n=1 Tax=Lachnoanaerobaculum sp. Marseille-Q4761 TaxID=2819511 RepID=UPI001AA1D38D|nr:GNAT family N-acetyltransferase [Lachnoanaerobaculum sp. Marseille-Q4761]MBO1871679.1 GNAT family N-acetyltransferase [Lachnoanaerobaculum sp. Marseille-Q4761]